ncbi:C39 family peptidase [Geoalkalibacter halelectricus]|uniref:C39 family peptidase n=1 Tax=Geoalkalibacter halelectricus TaxID=2847045 RepID=A0ABY5ZIQ3_9BACT|nr:C39 family peptidase [Geoalkalibacter halelectricus]MDO3378957.1 C39 family peptidase [Geoalkalibacter halelectricus]UWZ79020.1 C39 family peptidase [Geoalkalibacter halelectricus]
MGRKTETILALFIVFILLGGCAPQPDAWNAPVEIRLGNATVTRHVTPLRDMKFKNIVRQTKDYSCGAASLATIMTYYFDLPRSEIEILESLFLNADRATIKRIRERGISLLDLKNYGEAQGLVGQGYRMEPHQLKTLDRPAIVLVDLKGYSHFVVVRGVQEGRIHLADPARGHWHRSLEEFGTMWNGILLAFKRADGPRITEHELEIRPFWAHGPMDLLPRLMLDTQFAYSAQEF